MKKLTIWVIVLCFLPSVLATPLTVNIFIDIINERVKFELPSLFVDSVFVKYQGTDTVQPNEKIPVSASKMAIIRITDKGFIPQEITISPNTSIVWINDRQSLSALVLGVREIYGMKSPFMEPNGMFTQKFSESGRYTYVDGVVIGLAGTVLVQ